MKYAQINYSEKLGDSDQTIAESGALLTAFSNLLAHFGMNTAPNVLNEALHAKGIDPSNGMNWGFVSFFNPTVAVYTAGKGKPPEFGASIVKLVYPNKLTGGDAVTYAAVEDPVAGTITDSFDGSVKSWDVYGGPQNFVTFYQPELEIATSLRVPEPAVEAAAAPLELYKVVKALDGYNSPQDVTNGQNQAGVIVPGDYYIFGKEGFAFSLTKDPSAPGLWVNPAQNTTEVAEANDHEKIPVRHLPIDPLAWQQTYKPGLGVVETKAKNTLVIHDIAGEQPDVTLEAGDTVPVAGKFIHEGVHYFRTKQSADNGFWYGIPFGNLVPKRSIDDELDALLSTADDDLKHEFSDPTSRDKTIKTAATVEGKIKKLFSLGKKK